MKPALKYAFAAVVLLLSFAAPVATGPLEDATAADDRGDYATALLLLRELAAQCDARAQFKLGGMYDDGRGVAQSDSRALKWYRLAADQGYGNAQYNLALMVFHDHSLLSIGRRAAGALDPTDGHAEPDHGEVVGVALAADQLDAQGDGFVVGHRVKNVVGTPYQKTALLGRVASCLEDERRPARSRPFQPRRRSWL